MCLFKTEKIYSKIHHNISNDKILNSFLERKVVVRK